MGNSQPTDTISINDNQCDPDLQYKIAKMYYYGTKDVARNKFISLLYYKNAADQGHIKAQLKLDQIADKEKRKLYTKLYTKLSNTEVKVKSTHLELYNLTPTPYEK